MSYSPLDARLEFVAQIDDALQTKNIEKAKVIRNYYSEIGDDAEADRWNKMIKRWIEEETDNYDPEANQ